MEGKSDIAISTMLRLMEDLDSEYEVLTSLLLYNLHGWILLLSLALMWRGDVANALTVGRLKILFLRFTRSLLVRDRSAKNHNFIN